MPRFKITLEYDGGGFVGWQRQDNGLSVQQALEKAITGFSGETVTAFAAGAPTPASMPWARWPTSTWRARCRPRRYRAPSTSTSSRRRWRCSPPRPWTTPSTPASRPRRGPTATRISNRAAPLTLERGHAWRVPVSLDAEAMAAATRHLVGRHDFTTFRAVKCQAKSPVKTLDELSVGRLGDEIVIDARARSFLHHQVRNMAGSLKWVGEGKWTPDDIKRALAARDRAAGGETAPASGLYLVEVEY